MFEFSGGIIAISNLPLSRDPVADAVASRVRPLEHEPTDEMIAAFMREQALNGFSDMTIQTKEAKIGTYRFSHRNSD